MRSKYLAIFVLLLGSHAAPPPSQKKKSPATKDYTSSTTANTLSTAAPASSISGSSSGDSSGDSSATKGTGIGKGRLVIHVGPHKTGTSSTQFFLVQHVAWLNATFGIQVRLYFYSVDRYRQDKYFFFVRG